MGLIVWVQYRVLGRLGLVCCVCIAVPVVERTQGELGCL